MVKVIIQKDSGRVAETCKNGNRLATHSILVVEGEDVKSVVGWEYQHRLATGEELNCNLSGKQTGANDKLHRNGTDLIVSHTVHYRLQVQSYTFT